MDYRLTVVGESSPRTRTEDEDDALRLAQALANTEGVTVWVSGDRLNVNVEGDEHAFPELSFSERCQIVPLDVLEEMLADAESEHEMSWDHVQSITLELVRRNHR